MLAMFIKFYRSCPFMIVIKFINRSFEIKLFFKIIYNNEGGGCGFGCRDGNGVWRSWKTRGDVRSVRKGEEREGRRQSLYFMFAVCIYIIFILLNRYFL